MRILMGVTLSFPASCRRFVRSVPGEIDEG
jgi:hypothetical protein